MSARAFASYLILGALGGLVLMLALTHVFSTTKFCVAWRWPAAEWSGADAPASRGPRAETETHP